MPEENNTQPEPQTTESVNTAPTQSTPAPEAPKESTEAKKNVLMAVLSYLGILVVIPFLVAKDDPFVKFHIKQGLILLIIEIAAWFLGSYMFYMLWPLMKIINLVVFVLAIIGIVNAVKGREKELPLVGHLAQHIKI